MPAFIDIAGVADDRQRAAAARLAAGELGFDGVLISDYNAVAELITMAWRRTSSRLRRLALKAGVDIDMTSTAYVQGLPDALERGLVTMAAIDASVRRVLELKERLGLFDDPYRRGSAGPRRRPGRRAARTGARGWTASDRAPDPPRGTLAALPRRFGASP